LGFGGFLVFGGFPGFVDFGATGDSIVGRALID